MIFFNNIEYISKGLYGSVYRGTWDSHDGVEHAIKVQPANTGKDNSNKKAVTKIDQANKGILCKVIPGVLMFKIVVIKFTAPKIDEAPAKCKLKIAKSIAGPG